MLSASDPAPVEVVNPAASSALILTGDHAGNAVPQSLADFGLPRAELERHIAWDIGVAAVLRLLAARLNATAVLTNYTRLLIDPNRPLGDPASIPPISDGTALAANQNLTEDDRRTRADLFFWPYHRAIGDHIGRLRWAGKMPVVFALHSFTPALSAAASPRPWHVGVLYGGDQRFAKHLLAAFKARGDLVVGDNEPYSGMTHGFGLKMHGIAHGLPHVELEIRQDLISDAVGQEHWAGLLAKVLAPILEHEEMQRIEHH